MYLNIFYFYFAVVTENSGSFHKMMYNDERRHKKNALTKWKNREKCTYSLKAHTSSEKHTLRRITQNCNINKQNAHYKNNDHEQTLTHSRTRFKRKKKNNVEKKSREATRDRECNRVFSFISWLVSFLVPSDCCDYGDFNEQNATHTLVVQSHSYQTR